MLRIFRNRKAQATLEYAVLVAVIAAALITMKNYVKRGYQGKMRQNSDQLGQQFASDTVVDNNANTVALTKEKSYQGVSGSASYSTTKQSSKETGTPVGTEWYPR